MSSSRNRAAIGLGCSLGPRRATLERAVRQLAATTGQRLHRVSRWYRTPPMAGGAARGWFLNGVATFCTALTPTELLARCRQLEDAAGRRRGRHWADRPLDLDVLLVADHCLDSPQLRLPHPAIARRAFVLQPLLEVWPDARDPRSQQLYRDLPDPSPPRPVPVYRRPDGRGSRRTAVIDPHSTTLHPATPRVP